MFTIVQFNGVQPATIQDASGNSTIATLAATAPTVALLMGGKDGSGNIQAIKTSTTGIVSVDGSGVTQPISAISLPLPTGAATQTTLASILTNTPALGQAVMASSSPVVIASNQSAIPVTGTFFQTTQPVSIASAVAVTQSGAWSVTANIGTTNGIALDTSVNGLLRTQGSATASQTGPLVMGAVTTAAPAYTTAQTSPLSLTTAGGLRVDGSAVTQPVSIATSVTVTQGAAASLLATVTQGPAGATAWKVDGSAVTQPVSIAGTVTVAGTVTAANASVSATAATPPASATYIGGSVTTAAPTYTTGQMDPLSLTTAGALRVDASATTQPISAIALPLPTGAATQTTLASLLTNTPAPGQALMAASSPVVIASNQSAIPVTGTFFQTTQPVSIASTVAVTQSGTWTNTVTQATAANLNATVVGTVTANQGTANTIANAWPAKITDGTNSITVKAASTAAVATDTALVVAISPNNALTISTADTTASGTLNALNAATQIAMAGQQGAGFELAAGTLIGTIVAEVSFDGGTTWTATFFDQAAGGKVSSIVFASANPATASTIITAGGCSHARVRVSAFTSGTANISLRASQARDPSVLFSGLPAGSSPPTIASIGAPVTTAVPTYTTGTFNSLSLTTQGALRTDSSFTTQPVSGTLTVKLQDGAGNALASTGGALNVDITAGLTQWFYQDKSAFTYGGGTLVTPSSGVYQDTAPTLASGTLGALRLNAQRGLHTNLRTSAGVELLGSQLSAASVPVVIASDQAAIAALLEGQTSSSFSPDPGANLSSGPSEAIFDNSSNLQVRGQFTTDEGSFRDDFSGGAFATNLTGTTTFVNGSATVTGVGTTFTALTTDRYIKVASQSDNFYNRIDTILSDTQVLLSAPYAGASAAGVTAAVSYWLDTLVGTGAVTVSASEAVLTPGTGATGSVFLSHSGDYPPYASTWLVRITQRIANQIAVFGFQDVPGNPGAEAVVVIDGTTNTTVKFRTSFSSAAAEIQETVVTLPAGANTTASNRYEIDLAPDSAALVINGVVVANHFNHLPAPYVNMFVCAGITNSAVVTATTFAIDAVYFSNLDQIQVDQAFNGLSPTVASNQGTAAALSSAWPVQITDGTNKLPTMDVAARAGFQHITDGTNSAAVKPASTAAVASDPALVVAISPNNNPLSVASFPNSITQTYSAAITGLVAANTATDFFTLTGSATKTVRITRIALTATQTTGAQNNILLIKRSTANTGGTSTAPAGVPHDSTNAAATATVAAYTVNPTALGTVVGTMRSRKVFVGQTTANSDEFIADFGDRNNQSIVLRGTTQVLAINLNSTTLAGNSFDISVEWTEE